MSRAGNGAGTSAGSGARNSAGKSARNSAGKSARNSQPVLRILLLSYRSTPHVGGQGIFVRLLSQALVDLGHHVDVISGPPYPDLDARVGLIKLPSLDMYARAHPILSLTRAIIKNPLNLYEYLVHNSGGFPEPYTFGVRVARYMKDKTHLYDVVHDNQTLSYGILTLREYGLPLVGTIHHPISMDKRIDIAHAKSLALKFLKWRWYRFVGMQMKVARQITPIFVPSNNTKRDAVREFNLKPAQLHRVHLGINHLVFKPYPKIKRLDNQLMVTASADVPLKGLIYLIRAYADLLKTHPDLELLVVGRLREGQTKDELQRLGILDRVVFKSGLTSEEIAKFYAKATIAVSPSVYEGFGFPAGEALACGVPLVATNGGSLPEVVGDAGVIVQHSNAKALYDALDSLLKNPKARAALADDARQHILDNFTWQHCAQNTVALYLRAILEQSVKHDENH